MKKSSLLAAFALLFLSTSLTFGQSLKVTSGVGTNHLYTIDFDDNGYESNFETGTSYMLRLDFESTGEGALGNFFVKLERFNGVVDYQGYDCFCGVGLNPADFTNEKITKTNLAIGAFPLSMNLWKKGKIRFGIEYVQSISHEFENLYQNSRTRTPRPSLLVNRNKNINALVEIQMTKFYVSKSLFVQPVYNLSIGGRTEFVESAYNTRSIRQSIGFAFGFGV